MNSKCHRHACGGGGGNFFDIFTYKLWLLCIDLKTKVVQHVESECMRDWKSVRVRECESERELLLSLDMKTKVVQHVKREWMREWESERAREWESKWVREWLLSIAMKTKVVQHVESGWMRECESVRKHSWFPAFVWHSDIFLNIFQLCYPLMVVLTPLQQLSSFRLVVLSLLQQLC